MASADNTLLDVTLKNGRRLRLVMFPKAPLLTVSLGNYRHSENNAIVNVGEARQMRDALNEFIDIIDEEGGDPLERTADVG